MTQEQIREVQILRKHDGNLYLYLQNEWRHNGNSWNKYAKYFNQWFDNLTNTQILQFKMWMGGKCGPFYEF